MKKYLFYLLTLLIGWSCTQQEQDFPTGSSGYISFSSPLVELTGISSRAPITGTSFSEGTFGVLGYCLAHGDVNSGTTAWENKKTYANPHVFYNQKVNAVDGTYIATSGTTETEIKGGKAPWYGNNDYLYTFFAYYPYSSWGISPNSMSAIGVPLVTYTVNADMINQNKIPDLMAAALIDKKKDEGSLTFTFKHLLSGLNVKIINNTDNNVEVESLTLSGTFHQKLAVGLDLIPNVSGSISNGTFNYGSFAVNANDAVSSSTLLLPTSGESFSPSGNVGLTVSVKYNMGTGNKTFTSSLSELASFTPQAGVIYTLNIVFAGNNVTFYATPDNAQTWEDGVNDEVVFQ